MQFYLGNAAILPYFQDGMKPILPAFILISLATFLYGCPYDSPYNLDETPQQSIDEQLLGSWTALPGSSGYNGYKQLEKIKICFNKRTEMDYDFLITGAISDLKPYHVITNDTIRGTAYLSTISGRQFLNAYITGKVYIAELVKDSSSFSIMPLAEYFTSKLIKNSKELRTAVEFHYKVRPTPGYDPIFCVRKLRKETGLP
jgi:hypothetical protein